MFIDSHWLAVDRLLSDNDPAVLDLYLHVPIVDHRQIRAWRMLKMVALSYKSPEALRVFLHFLAEDPDFRPEILVRDAWHAKTIEQIIAEFPKVSFNHARTIKLLTLAAVGCTSLFHTILTSHVTDRAFYGRLVQEMGKSFLESDAGDLQRIIYAILTTPFRDPTILQLILHEISASESLCAAIASQAPEYFEAMLFAVDDPTIFRHPESAEVSDIVEPVLRWSPARAAFVGAVARAGAARAAAYIGVRKAHEFRVLMGSLPLERKREVMQQFWEKHYQRYPKKLAGAGREEILDAFLGQFSVEELRALDFADKNYFGYDYVGRHDDQDTIRRAVERILREWSPIREAWVTAVMQGLRKKTQKRF